VPILAVPDKIVVECDGAMQKKVKARIERIDEVLNGPDIGGPRVPIEAR
jgi:hypothetical protein